MTRVSLAEARPLLEAETPSGGRLAVQLINPGWGSSGHYSADVLAEAAQRRVFPAGLHMFLDHPTAVEKAERPERSVRDLAAVLTTDATVDPDTGALVAEAQVFAPHAQVLAEMRDAIGLSIRAMGSFEMGEAEGRKGRIITALDEALSVDFVTSAGRGGRILEVLESARLNEATANDTQKALSDAIAEQYRIPDSQWAWVRDYDPDAGLVYFDVNGPDMAGTFQQAYEQAADGTCSLAGDPVEVAIRTLYVPVDPAGQSTTTESQGGTMPEIEEARLRQLETDAGRVPTLESERDAAAQRAEVAERRLAEHDARQAARPIVAEVFEGAQLPASTQARVIESLVEGAPLTDQGALDEAALRTTATAARTQAETEIAEALQAAGVGTVRGFGGGATQSGQFDEAAYDQRAASVFGRPTVKGA